METSTAGSAPTIRVVIEVDPSAGLSFAPETLEMDPAVLGATLETALAVVLASGFKPEGILKAAQRVNYVAQRLRAGQSMEQIIAEMPAAAGVKVSRILMPD